MSDDVLETKPRRASRKGMPPSPTDTLGAIVAVPAKAPRARKAALATDPAAEPSIGPAAEQAPSEPPKPRKARPAEAAPEVVRRSKPLNFRVTPEFRRAFKQAAANADLKKVELLEKMFEVWSSAPR